MDENAGHVLRLALAIPTAAVGAGALALAWRARRTRPRAAGLFAAGAAVLVGWTGLEYAIYDWPDLNTTANEVFAVDWEASWAFWWAAEQVAHVLALLLFAGAFVAADHADP